MVSMTRSTILSSTFVFLAALVSTTEFSFATAFVLDHHWHSTRIGHSVNEIASRSRGVKNLHLSASSRPSVREELRNEWIDRSLSYYSKVMREERRRTVGQVRDFDTNQYQDHFRVLAKKHYFALRKIKDGKPEHAEFIYRRIIGELMNEDDDQCDHAKLAVTTLLLALLMQRSKDAKKARSVFLNFFRTVIVDSGDGELEECACSAKVMQAYALFEMKQGNALKSLELVELAVQLDPTLEPVLSWKQFRDAKRRQKTLRP